MAAPKFATPFGGTAERADRRQALRTRTRLRPGKVLSADGAFLADCAILDRSADGARVRLYGPGEGLNGEVRLFDEAEASARTVRLAWRRGGEAGLRHAGEPWPIDADARRRVLGRYYAVAD